MNTLVPTCSRRNRALPGSGKVDIPPRSMMMLDTLGLCARPVLTRPNALKARSSVPDLLPPTVVVAVSRSSSPEAMISSPLESLVDGYPKVTGGQPYLSNDSAKALQKADKYLKDLQWSVAKKKSRSDKISLEFSNLFFSQNLHFFIIYFYPYITKL